jgi:predicted transcriptional regulator
MGRPHFDERIAGRITYALQHLQPEGMTVTDMVRRTNLNKRTVMKYLKTLEKKEVVIHYQIGNYKVYRLK